MSRILNEKVKQIQMLAPGIFKMTLFSDYVSENAKPGQFVNVKCGDGINALLRRPISICSVSRAAGTFDMVFQLKGIGTEILSKKRPGDLVDIIAPLGNPFAIPSADSKIAVVGGGIGIFPLLFLLKEYKASYKKAFLGFRSKEFVVLEEEFSSHTGELLIATDDGSKGSKGLVTELLQKDLAKGGHDLIYTCGPMPMIKRVAGLASNAAIRCQVSMEQRMGCGIGACLVCACKTRLGDEWEYSHVCKDGPVYWAEDVIFE